MVNTIVDIRLYDTWYDFKKNLQARTGVLVLNDTWLKIKPKKPLPWSELEMENIAKLISG